MANGFQEEIKTKVDIKCFIVCLIGKKKGKKNLSCKTSFFFQPDQSMNVCESML